MYLVVRIWGYENFKQSATFLSKNIRLDLRILAALIE